VVKMSWELLNLTVPGHFRGFQDQIFVLPVIRVQLMDMLGIYLR